MIPFKRVQVGVLALALVIPFKLQAAGKKSPDPAPVSNGKKVIALTPVENVQIEMPDQSLHNFGEDFQASLTTQLMQSGRYIVADPLNSLKMQEMETSRTPSGYQWNGSVTPVATVRIQVDALNFATGSRGDRMFYGFDERLRTPFNDGTGALTNEFPLRLFNPNEPSWFRSSFQQKGSVPFDSRSGLDLGDGFQLDFLVAWLNVKYASYHSELHLKLSLDSPAGEPSQSRLVEVVGDGFFFDISGGYEQYSGGITVARTDAMSQALQSALAGSFGALDRALSSLPLMAKVDVVLDDGTLLLGTGPGSEIPGGVLYEVVDHPQVTIEVSSSVASGSIGHVVHGDPALIKAEQILRQVFSIPSDSPSLAALPLAAHQADQTSTTAAPTLDSTQLPSTTLPQANLGGWVPSISRWEAFLTSLVEGVFLPYRIWRYFMYDQAYHKYPDWGYSTLWDLSRESWSSSVGLANIPPMLDGSFGGTDPVVAIIDSGVDYNHPALHDSLWLNPASWQDSDGRKDRYGWDFISEDSRPYDDGYHGTQVASVVLGVAPKAKIMPLKIFNPWGITNSASVYGAFTYAVDHGAQVILCSWAGVKSSQALSMGISYARDHGVVVVAAAGDDGMNLSLTPYYPAAFSAKYDNVMTVTAVDSQDQLIHEGFTLANYDPHLVQLAAPGADIPVAEPRASSSRETSTDLAAAMVAGGIARYLNPSETYRQWMTQLLIDSDSIPSLEPAVQGGLRLHLRR